MNLRRTASFLTIFVFCALFHLFSFASSSCVGPDRAAFIADVVKPADLIILAEITGQTFTGDTVVVIHENYLPGDEQPRKVKISGWKAYDPALSNYKKGDRLVLFLKKDKDSSSYNLTDGNWKSCVPAVARVRDDGGINPVFSYDPEYQAPMSPEEFKTFIGQSR